MFETIKTITCRALEKEVIKRIGENKFSKELDAYLFEGCENDSYNRIRINYLKDDIADAEDGYANIAEEDMEDYVKTWNCIIEILEEEGIREDEDVVVWVCW